MIISLNWLKKFTDIDMPIDELATLIGARLVEIEEIINLGEKYKDVLVVKVIEISKLENSDHLNVVKINDGGVTPELKRDESGLIQVVCGSPNLEVGQLVAWLPPKSIVPETFGSLKPLVMDTRMMLGFDSNGMIASSRELGLSDDHEGNLVVDIEIAPGTSFAKAYELDDYLLNIENKSLTHRPDCFGIIGFAREISAITGKKFKTPEYLLDVAPNINVQLNNEIALSVAIDNPELSSRYCAIVMSDIDNNKKTPLLIQTYLSRVGIRPISTIVDITNYVMLVDGQPLHAFDYDKVVNIADGKADIHVRAGREKENLTLLDGRSIELTAADIVISAGEKAIALAGAMGGADTEIDNNTKNIIIESATFNLYNLRSTQMRHGIFSEAITRFTKGQPAGLALPVLARAVSLMNESTGAMCVSDLAESYPVKSEQILIELNADTVNQVLGSTFSLDEIIGILQNVEFIVEKIESDKIKISVPFWRADIYIVEDLIEEIGRLMGFDNIEPTLPIRDFTAIRPDSFDDFRSKARKIMSRAGANEVLTYSFIHSDVIKKAGQNVDNSYRIVNSISPDLQYYRQTLTPSLLGLMHPNIKQGYENFAIFEINKAHLKQDGLTSEGVPVEYDKFALVVTKKNTPVGAPYYQAKRILEYLCESLGVNLDFRTLENKSENPLTAPFEYRRSALVLDRTSGQAIGVVGEYKKSVANSFKLSEYTAGFEIDTRLLFEVCQKLGSGYKPLSRYPASERDICFQVEESVSYSQIIDSIGDGIKDIELETSISPVDIYQSESSQTKNITIRVKLEARDHTLTGDEVTNVVNSLVSSVVSKTQATVI